MPSTLTFDRVSENKGYLSFLSIDALKDYFDVSNSYVLQKLKLILFPFTLKTEEWRRKQVGMEFSPDDLVPRNDTQAPDLYLPLMSFVTFILLTGFLIGTRHNSR